MKDDSIQAGLLEQVGGMEGSDVTIRFAQCNHMPFAECNFCNPMSSLHPSQRCLTRQTWLASEHSPAATVQVPCLGNTTLASPLLWQERDYGRDVGADQCGGE